MAERPHAGGIVRPLPQRAYEVRLMDFKVFLAHLEPRRLTQADAGPLEPVGLMIGPGSGGLEVAVARSERKPTQDALRNAWKNRQGGRATPVLLVALHGDRAALCGPAGEVPPVFLDLDMGQVERICRTALAERNRHAAARFLWSLSRSAVGGEHSCASGAP